MYQRPLHVLVGVGFWLLFGLLWVDLVRDGAATPASLSRTALLVGLVAVVVLGVTGAWVRHNVGLHRRLGPRPGTALVAPRTDVDRLGRPVVWALPAGHLRAAETAHLVVELDEDRTAKTYRAAPVGG